MIRVVFAAALIAVSMISFTPAAHATRSIEDVLARLDALERENATLRKRVQRLEATERERPVVASLPTAAPRATAVARSAAPAPSAVSPAAGQAYAAVPTFAPPQNWTGLYLGASGGMRREDHKWTTNSTGLISMTAPNNEDLTDTGARFGGFIGYNFQLTPKLVAGIEADFAWGKTKTSTNQTIPGTIAGGPIPFLLSDTSFFETQWDASLRARIGALVTPDTLAYLTGGMAWQRIKAQVTCDANFSPVCITTSLSDTQSDTLTGWTLGAGIESALAGAWTGRIEYRYAQYGDFNHLFMPLAGCLCDGNLDTTISLSTHTFIAGIAYKFGGY
jgi:outer membrane immunogenic protein